MPGVWQGSHSGTNQEVTCVPWEEKAGVGEGEGGGGGGVSTYQTGEHILQQKYLSKWRALSSFKVDCSNCWQNVQEQY